MAYQEAKRIFEEIQGLFESRLILIRGDHSYQAELPQIDFKNELEKIPVMCYAVEQHTVSLLQLYQKDALIQNVLLDLFKLKEYSLEFIYRAHQSAILYAPFKLRGKRFKVHYLLELYVSFTKYGDFLNLYLLPVRIGHVPGTVMNFNPPHCLQLTAGVAPQAPETEEEVLVKEVYAKKIALLYVFDVLDHPKIKHLDNTEKRKIFRYITGGSDRLIKGNIAVLNPHTNESLGDYTSHLHVGWAKKVLNGTESLVKPKKST